MFANLNLHFTTSISVLDAAPIQPNSTLVLGPPGEGGLRPFSDLLDLAGLSGESLPMSGKDLPVFVPPQPAEALPVAGPDLDISIAVAYLQEAPILTGDQVPRSVLVAEPVAIETVANVQVRATEFRADAPAFAAAEPVENLTPARSLNLPPGITTATPSPVQTASMPVALPEAAIVAEGLQRDKTATPARHLPPIAVDKAPPGNIKLADIAAADTVPPTIRSVEPPATPGRAEARLTVNATPPMTTPAHLSTNMPAPSTELSSSLPKTLAETIATPVRDAGWGEKLGERVLMLTANQIKTAEIRLTPAELGPLRVHIGVDDGAANITFHAQQAAAREAIEQALPRLREMLAESGLSLGDTHVGEHGVADGKADRETDKAESEQVVDETSEESGENVNAPQRETVGARNLLDTFA